jgi:hypothetical protein
MTSTSMHRSRPTGSAWARAVGLALAALALAASANAAPIHVSLSSVAAPPRATVVVSIDVDQSLTPYNVTSIGFQLTLDPSRIASASFNTTNGLIASWGTPFTNVTPTVAAALGVGFTPIASTNTRVQNVYLRIGASVPTGTDIPLAFQSFVLNDGTPAVTLGTGVIHVSSAAGVGDAAGAALALGSPAPNPARAGTRFSVSIPGDGMGVRARVEVLDLAGRRVRELTDEVLPPGRHELSWDGRDAGGSPIATGLYWVTLERGGARQQRRIVVVR